MDTGDQIQRCGRTGLPVNVCRGTDNVVIEVHRGWNERCLLVIWQAVVVRLVLDVRPQHSLNLTGQNGLTSSCGLSISDTLDQVLGVDVLGLRNAGSTTDFLILCVRIAKQTHHPAVYSGRISKRIGLEGSVMEVAIEVHQLIVNAREAVIHRLGGKNGRNTLGSLVGETTSVGSILTGSQLGNRLDGSRGVTTQLVSLRIQGHQANDPLHQFRVATGDLTDSRTRTLVPVLGIVVHGKRMLKQLNHVIDQFCSVTLSTQPRGCTDNLAGSHNPRLL